MLPGNAHTCSAARVHKHRCTHKQTQHTLHPAVLRILTRTLNFPMQGLRCTEKQAGLQACFPGGRGSLLPCPSHFCSPIRALHVKERGNQNNQKPPPHVDRHSHGYVGVSKLLSPWRLSEHLTRALGKHNPQPRGPRGPHLGLCLRTAGGWATGQSPPNHCICALRRSRGKGRGDGACLRGRDWSLPSGDSQSSS